MDIRDTTEIRTERLLLTPLKVAAAFDMVDVLADTSLYKFTGDTPPTLEELTTRYEHQVNGPQESVEIWHNWIVRLSENLRAVGFVQCTITGDSADVAWVIGTSSQGRGFAREAGAAMCHWLTDRGATRITAHIHPDHTASKKVATAIGLHMTTELDEDSEDVWSSGTA